MAQKFQLQLWCSRFPFVKPDCVKITQSIGGKCCIFSHWLKDGKTKNTIGTGKCFYSNISTIRFTPWELGKYEQILEPVTNF